MKVVINSIKKFLFIQTEGSPHLWLAKFYNFFIASEVILILIFLIGQTLIHGFNYIYGQGQAGHVTPGAWMIGLPFLFLGALGIGLLKFVGAGLSIVALIKKYLAKYFILATALLFVLTGWSGERGIIGNFFKILDRLFK